MLTLKYREQLSRIPYLVEELDSMMAAMKIFFSTHSQQGVVLDSYYDPQGGVIRAQGMPVGTILLYAGVSIPDGWLSCNGQEVNRAEYPDLFEAIKGKFGTGDGSTTFNLPDFRGRVPIKTGLGSGLTVRALGDTGGAETHALTEAELATHDHTVTDGGHSHGVTDPGHTHPIGITDTIAAGAGSKPRPGANNAATSSSNTTGLTVNSATTGLTVDNAGSGDAHENMPPFLAVHFIIKT